METMTGRTKRHGGPRVSIKDVADAVEEAARTFGYVASPTASGLAGGRTKTIGVLAFPGSRWFHSRALDGATLELRTHNYHLALFDLKDTRDQLGSVLTTLQRCVDAVLGIRILLDELNGKPGALDSAVARHRLEVRSTTSQAPN